MESIKAKVDDLLFILKKENPNANWKNLVTGVAILILVSTFSIWYFSTTPSDTTLIDELRSGNGLTINEDFTGNSAVLGNSDEIDSEGMIEVKKGEGLWHVAKRVCGDGEKYNFLADANNLNVHWARLVPGQKLKVSCGK